MLQYLERWMSANEPLKGHIIITSEIDDEIESLKQRLAPHRVVVFYEESFKLEHAKGVTAEAYISTSEVKYIILAAVDFNDVAQNSLLKLLEEPPTNIEFILISPTKSNLLPTVRSRLPILKIENSHAHFEVNLDFVRLDYDSVFTFLKEHARVQKNEAKALVEAVFHKACVVDGVKLSERQLANFDMAYRLIELNARTQSILSMLLMGFIEERG